MDYKLIAIDLDDTLLDEQKRVTAREKDAIKRAMEKGVHIVLVSGRAYQSINIYNNMLGINDYTICLAGGQVVDTDGHVVFSANLPPVAAKQVMRWAALRNIHYQVYLEEGLRYPKHSQFSDFYEKQCSMEGEADPDLLEREPILTPKILMVDTAENIAKYRAEVTQMFPEFLIQNSQLEYLEVLNPETSKGTGLAFVAKKLDIAPEQIIAIGDSDIDASMMEYAGLGIAVKNARPHILEMADYITDACDDDGVAKAIEKFVLDK